MAYFLSERSKNRLDGVNPILREIIEESIKLTPIDFGIPPHGGKRTAEEQNKIFFDGNSKCDGYDKISKHQSGNAFDFYAFIGGNASWDPVHLALLAGVFMSVAKSKGVYLLWGGEFGSDKFKGWDMGHMEIME